MCEKIRKVKFIKVTLNDIKQHIKPNLVLFIPVVAISLYKMMDKIMLGSLSNVIEVGYYENAEKIINIPMTLITALGTVMLPRISNIMAKGQNEKVGDYIYKSINFVMFMSLAMCFGLIAIGYNFAPIYFGDEFQKTGVLIMFLAVTLPVISFANVLRTQYLIPVEKDRIYIISVILGAIINLIMNFIFIPVLASIGACIGTIMLYQSVSVRNELEINRYIKSSFPFLIKSIIMFTIVFPINFIEMNEIIRIMIQVIVGGIVYCILNLKYIFSMINIKK